MILSLDIAYRNIGWAVSNNNKIIDTGVIKTKKLDKKSKKGISSTKEHCNNIKYIVKELDYIILKYPDIDYVCGELPHSGSQSATASYQMGLITGLIVTYFLTHNFNSKWVSPNNVKIAVCGKLKAEKEEIMDTITKMYPDYKFPKAKCKFEHIADAIGALLVLQNENIYNKC